MRLVLSSDVRTCVGAWCSLLTFVRAWALGLVLSSGLRVTGRFRLLFDSQFFFQRVHFCATFLFEAVNFTQICLFYNFVKFSTILASIVGYDVSEPQ